MAIKEGLPMAIRPKTTIQMSLTGAGQTHARTVVKTRDVTALIDEPMIRGGTNLGPSPTETFMASLIGCTNVISSRIAQKMGLVWQNLDVELSAEFNRLGTMLEEEVEHPFANIVMDISVETNASEQELEKLKSDLSKFCPIARVIRNSGITITENWSTKSI